MSGIRRTAESTHIQRDTPDRWRAVFAPTLNYIPPGETTAVPIDATPVPGTDALGSGWRITQAPATFFAGTPAGKGSSGWIGVGFDAGTRWIRYRLARAGVVNLSTRAWGQTLATAAYTGGTAFADAASAVFDKPLSGGVTWDAVLGAGTSLACRFDGRAVEDIVRVDAARRAAWAAAVAGWGSRATNALVLEFEVEFDGAPALDGAEIGPQAEPSWREGRMEFRVGGAAFAELRPLSALGVEGTDAVTNMQKVLARRDGRLWLSFGITLAEFDALPPGALIFDPTFDAGASYMQATRDDSWEPNANYSAWGEFAVLGGGSWRNMYMRIDCSSIPAGSVCTAAWIEFSSGTFYTTYPGDPTWDVHSLHENVATWNHQQLTYTNYKASTPWPGTSGARTPGVDYEPTLLGSATIPKSNLTRFSVSISPARVQQWFGSSVQNYGLKFTLSSDYRSVIGPLYSNASHRPVMYIEYTLEPPPPATAVGSATAELLLGSTSASTPVAAAVGSASCLPSVGSSPPVELPRKGNISLSSQSAGISVALIAPDGTNWCMVHGGAPVQITLAVERRRAALTPK